MAAERVSQSAPESAPESEAEEEAGKTLVCPECGDSLDPRGFRGHLQFAHSITGDPADELFEAAKEKAASTPETTPGSGPRGVEGGGRDPGTTEAARGRSVAADIPEDEIDEILSDILRRYDQRAKVGLVRDLADDETDDRSAVGEIKEFAEAAESIKSLFGDDERAERRDSELAAALKEIAAQRQPAADGGHETLTASLIASGEASPEMIEAAAEYDRMVQQESVGHRVLDLVEDLGTNEILGMVNAGTQIWGSVKKQARAQQNQPERSDSISGSNPGPNPSGSPSPFSGGGEDDDSEEPDDDDDGAELEEVEKDGD